MKIPAILGVALILALVPIQFPELPLNLELADVLGFAVLPLLWVWIASEGRGVRAPYLGAMGLVLGVAALSAFFSEAPRRGLIVVAKELYLYAWFVSIATAFERAGDDGFRRLCRAWLVGAVVNGVVVVAQFLQPALLVRMNSAVAGLGHFDPYRASGFFSNCNVAAFYQVLAFVPLVALDLPARKLIALGMFLFVTVVCTASMGALLALVAGLGFGLLLLAFVFNQWNAVLRLGLGVGISGGLLLAVVLVGANVFPEFGDRLEAMFFGRADRSAGSRFDIWKSGFHFVWSGFPLVGIGPEQFHAVDGRELHSDLISFTVERGLLGLLSLVVLVVAAIGRALATVRLGIRQGRPWTLVFPAAVVAICVEAMTHEVFHMRQVWMALAIQEAVLWKSRIEVGRRSSAAS